MSKIVMDTSMHARSHYNHTTTDFICDPSEGSTIYKALTLGDHLSITSIATFFITWPTSIEYHKLSLQIPTMPIDLSNPGRTIRAGVILMGETEILDVAPIDFLHGLNKKFGSLLPLSDELKAQLLDIEFHWVNEKGDTAKLTSGITMNATVRRPILHADMHLPNKLSGFLRVLSSS